MQDRTHSGPPVLPAATSDGPLPSWPLPEGLSSAPSLASACAGLRADAESLLDGGFCLLGLSRAADQRTDWNLDPETGNRWPSDRFCFDVDFRHAHAGLDVKAAWELHRLQHLQLLAWHAHLASDERARPG